MKENNFEIYDSELDCVVGGKTVSTVELIKELHNFAKDYPDVIVILEAYEKGDYAKVITLLQKLFVDHPELTYLIKD